MSSFYQTSLYILHSNGSAIFENSNYIKIIAYLPSNFFVYFQCILRLENRGTLWKMTKLNKINILNTHNTQTKRM